jgi:hypothetical protein
MNSQKAVFIDLQGTLVGDGLGDILSLRAHEIWDLLGH